MMKKARYFTMLFLAVVFVGVVFWNFKEFYTLRFNTERIFLQKKYLVKLKQTYSRFLWIKKVLEYQKKVLEKIVKSGFTPENYRVYPFVLKKKLSWEELETVINLLNIGNESVLYVPQKFSVGTVSLPKSENMGVEKGKRLRFSVDIKGKFITRIE